MKRLIFFLVSLTTTPLEKDMHKILGISYFQKYSAERALMTTKFALLWDLALRQTAQNGEERKAILNVAWTWCSLTDIQHYERSDERLR